MTVTSQRPGLFSLSSGVSRSATAAVDERRAAERRRMCVPVHVLTLGCQAALQCQADDISEAGIFVRAPQSAGLRVGQRCEVNFEEHADAPQLSCLVGGTWFATVVRTEQVTEGAAEHVGAGLRFDQPLFL